MKNLYQSSKRFFCYALRSCFIFLTLACLTLFFISTPSYSAGLFSVDGIKVEVTADDSVIAKRQGYLEAQKRALNKLYLRIVPYNYIERIPDIDKIGASGNDFENFIKSFSVNNEITTKVTYKAEFSIDFNEAAITGFLQSNAIPYSTEQGGGDSVIIPIYIVPGKQLELFEGNPWLSAWEKLDVETVQVPLKLPDVADKIFEPALLKALATGKSWAVRTVAKYYDNEYIIVAVFSLPDAAQSDSLPVYRTSIKGYTPTGDIKIERNYRSSNPTKILTEQIARIYMRIMEHRWQKYHSKRQKQRQNNTATNFDNGIIGDGNFSRNNFGNKNIRQPSKNFTNLQEKDKKVMFLANFNSYRSWVGIRDTLLRLFGEDKITLRAITSKNAYVELSTLLAEAEIYDRVKRNGLRISTQGDYVLIYQ